MCVVICPCVGRLCTLKEFVETCQVLDKCCTTLKLISALADAKPVISSRWIDAMINEDDTKLVEFPLESMYRPVGSVEIRDKYQVNRYLFVSQYLTHKTFSDIPESMIYCFSSHWLHA